MDPAKIGYLSYRRHRICNPFSFDQLERVLGPARLEPGDRAADLGCGNGVVSAWLAERYGLDLTGVERYGAVAALARETAARPRARGQLGIVEGGAADYLREALPHRLVSVLGAVDLLPGLVRPAETMAALVPSIVPGGWLLWGDPFWARPPSPRLDAVFGAARYETHAGWVAAGEAAGLVPFHASVSAAEDWEIFFWTMNASLEDWAAAHPDDPDSVAVRARAAMLRSLFLEEGREAMGFGLYLFQRPGGA